jgi:aspartokinase-like uncharacterized kinase
MDDSPQQVVEGWRITWLRSGDRSARCRGVVVKLGGSLLARPGWPASVGRLLRRLTEGAIPEFAAGPPLIVVGGGPIVDGLRVCDRAVPQPDEIMHELAIRGMRLTARFVATVLELPVVLRPGSGAGVLDPVAIWRSLPSVRDLPPGWHVTSDSIAAATAAGFDLPLLLLKASPPPRMWQSPDDSVSAETTSGWVDPFFARAAAGVCPILAASPG